VLWHPVCWDITRCGSQFATSLLEPRP
jgi:hypothetical protein